MKRERVLHGRQNGLRKLGGKGSGLGQQIFLGGRGGNGSARRGGGVVNRGGGGGLGPFILHRIFVLAGVSFVGRLTVAGALAKLGSLVLKPDLHFTGGPVELLSNLGADFKGREGVNREGPSENGDFLPGSSFALFVEVLGGLDPKIDLGRGASAVALDALQSLGGLKSPLCDISSLAGDTAAKGKKPENTVLEQFLVILFGGNIKKLVGDRVLEIKDRHFE